MSESKHHIIDRLGEIDSNGIDNCCLCGKHRCKTNLAMEMELFEALSSSVDLSDYFYHFCSNCLKEYLYWKLQQGKIQISE